MNCLVSCLGVSIFGVNLFKSMMQDVVLCVIVELVEIEDVDVYDWYCVVECVEKQFMVDVLLFGVLF